MEQEAETGLTIGFDLDGVLCPDIDIDSLEGELDSTVALSRVIAARQLLMPMFKPKGNFVVVTGRPYYDLQYTKQWLQRHFGFSALLIHNDVGHLKHEAATNFKARHIKAMKLKTYVESSLTITQMLREACPNTNIIHFDALVINSLGIM